jgi:hypothetical protein
MKGHTELEMIDQREMWLFSLATLAVAQIPEGIDETHGGETRCHEVARAVGRCLDLPVMDGLYGVVDHSWLLIEDPRRNKRKILDVYCVARIPIVQIIDPHPYAGHGGLYQPRSLRTDIRHQVVRAMRMNLRALHQQFKEQRKLYPILD